MKERDVYIPAKRVSAVDTPEIIRPVRGQTDTKARIIDLFIKKSLGMETSSIYVSDVTTSMEFAAALVKRFVESYRTRPLQAAEYFIAALFDVIQDDAIEETERKQFLSTALDEYMDLLVRLDRLAFPPYDVLYEGIPEYLPNGLSDMGHFSETDPLKRQREKIRINKIEVYRDHKDFLLDLLWFLQENNLSPQTEAWEKVVFYKVLDYVHDQMPYDNTFSAAVPKDRSVSLMEFGKHKLKALCRHQALLTQVLLQFAAVNSRLYRCDVWNVTFAKGGRHVANIAQVGNNWYLGDVTSPETDPINSYDTMPFIRQVPGTLHEIPQVMNFTKLSFVNGLARNMEVRFTTVTDMKYRIRDNNKDVLR